MPGTLYLIDGHAQFFRAYFAIRGGLNSPVTSEPTNMVYGFTSLLVKLLSQHHPDYLVVVIDRAGDRETFRSAIYPEYKAHRESPPEDFGPQVERCLQVCGTLGIPVLAVEGVEADDVIATIVRRMRREDPSLRIRIVSKDKDLGQLMDDHVTLFDGNTGEEVTVETLFETKGVRPEQVVDMLALMGDPVDNVPGVPGIGPKTAAALITEHGSLEALLAHADQVKGKRGEAIRASRDTISLARRLVALKDDCEVPFQLSSARADPARLPAGPAMDLLHTLGFGRLRDEVRKLFREPAGDGAAAEVGAAAGTAPNPAAPNPAAPNPPASDPPRTSAARPRRAVARPVEEGDGLFGTPPSGAGSEPAALAPPRAVDGSYEMVADAKALAAVVTAARQAAAEGGVIAVDTETDGLSPVGSHLCGISLSWRERHGVYVPVRSPEPERHLDLERVVAGLKPLLEDEAIPKVGHNLKFDLNILRNHGIRMAGVAGDSMVESYVVDATRTSHGLDALAEALLAHRCIPLTDLLGSGKSQRTFDQVPLGPAVDYAAEDADVALRLHHVLSPRVRELGLEELYRRVELPLVAVLAEMEWNGIKVDVAELERQRALLEGRMAGLRRRIIDASPRPFNPDSPKQLSEVLFNAPEQDPPGLGLRVVKRTRTGASTDVEVLEKLAADPEVTSEIPALVVEYRQLAKLVGTYLVALRDAVDPVSGRVHASFHQTGTATGRISSSDPNLQNIPIRTELGRDIRRAFVAPAGRLLVAADYSQIELRILAHLSGDEGLCEAFRQDQDIHRAVAAEVYGVAPDAVTDEQRSAAKMVNFGIVYGITAWGLARRLGAGTGVGRAQEIIDGYKARFRGIDAFLAACVEQARREGFVTTMLGRRRAVPQVHSRNPAERALGERIAINTVVQGSAADLIKLAMIELHRILPARHPGARMLLQIHDELLFETPAEDAPSLQRTVKEAMEGAMTLRVPLKVEGGCGESWHQA